MFALVLLALLYRFVPIQTVPGKGWFSRLRLYSPTEAWFEGEWLPGEFELVK